MRNRRDRSRGCLANMGTPGGAVGHSRDTLKYNGWGLEGRHFELGEHADAFWRFLGDSLGADTLDRTFSAVRKLGHVINIGEAEGNPIENIRQRCLVRSQTFTRFHLGHAIDFPELWQKGNQFILDALHAGWLNPTIVDRFELEHAREMHAAIENRTNSGKLLLRTSPETGS